MVATAERVGKVARIGGWGGGVWLIRAMPELKRFFSFDVVPNALCQNLRFPNTFFSDTYLVHSVSTSILKASLVLLCGGRQG